MKASDASISLPAFAQHASGGGIRDLRLHSILLPCRHVLEAWEVAVSQGRGKWV